MYSMIMLRESLIPSDDARFGPPAEPEIPLELAKVPGSLDQKKLAEFKPRVKETFDRLVEAVGAKGPAFSKALEEWRQLEQDVAREAEGRQELIEQIIRPVQSATVEKDLLPRRQQMERIWAGIGKDVSPGND